ncbi:SRPBCC family protein [Glycomyces sp. YM15]|uniref:SRPBCC family protein n=1 Tax=Glycomyces sp. YM15 TaxID=2800446 RepID=UPI001965BC56|nr:SRPBCC family protein [Glycomyces sp. YM15]
MAPLISTIDIDRPPDVVFAYATDPTRFPEWQRDVIRVQILDDEEFMTVRRFVGAERTTLQRITADDPPRHWAAEGVEGAIRPHATVTVSPRDDGAHSRVVFTLDFEGHGMGAVLLPMVRRAAEKGAPVSHRHLKEILERDSAE